MMNRIFLFNLNQCRSESNSRSMLQEQQKDPINSESGL